MDLERYTAWAAQQIGQAFVKQQIGVTLRQRVAGPRALTFVLELHDPDPRAITTALKLGPTLEATLAADQVDIRKQNGLIHITLPNPSPGLLPVRRLRGQGLAVPLGLTRRNDLVGVDFTEPHSAHLLLVGPTGGGKSNAGRAIVYHLARQNNPDQVRLFVVGGDPGDWRGVTDLPHCWTFVHHRHAPQPIDWLRDQVERREATNVRAPHIFAILDDTGEIPALADLVPTLTGVIRQGRRVGVHLVILAHGADNANLGSSQIAANLTRRLVFGAASAADAARASGRSATRAHTLLGAGEAITVGDGDDQPVTLARCAYQDLTAIAAALNTKYPAHRQTPPWATLEPPWRSCAPSPTQETQMNTRHKKTTGGGVITYPTDFPQDLRDAIWRRAYRHSTDAIAPGDIERYMITWIQNKWPAGEWRAFDINKLADQALLAWTNSDHNPAAYQQGRLF